MIAPFIYGSTASLHCAALPYLYSWESGIGRHWCVCRGGACPARPRSGKRTAKSIGCTAVSAVPPDVSLRGGHRPTWQSREGSYDFVDGFPVSWSGTARLHPKGTSSRFALRAPRRFAPRNDKSGAVAVLTAAGTNRSCSAGRGMPRPYKGSCHFNDALYESAVYRRARLSPPLQHPAVCRIFFIVPYSPGKIHPVGKKRSLSVKSMEKRLKTGPFCDTINLYQNECTARRRGLHLHTDTTIIGGKHHECSRDHGTAQRIFL